jgi:nucleotide-binding universal stress UspA family protein
VNPRAVIAGSAGPGTVAVEWAADEARLRGRPLRIVHVLEWDHADAWPAGEGSYVERVWSSSAPVTGAAAERARAVAPELEIRVDTLIGHPAERLLELGREADLLVVGHRGRGGFAGLRLGSVSRRLATHASCPVAVVRGRPHPGGPVVAGVDEAPDAIQILDTAFAEASARQTRLVVAGPATALTPEQERLEPWRRLFPRVPVEVVPTGANIAAVLAGASAGAQLVVVGSHSRGTLRGALLGSACQQLLQEAECPVLITRTRD